jgi:hypothetical protein
MLTLYLLHITEAFLERLRPSTSLREMGHVSTKIYELFYPIMLCMLVRSVVETICQMLNTDSELPRCWIGSRRVSHCSA